MIGKGEGQPSEGLAQTRFALLRSRPRFLAQGRCHPQKSP